MICLSRFICHGQSQNWQIDTVQPFYFVGSAEVECLRWVWIFFPAQLDLIFFPLTSTPTILNFCSQLKPLTLFAMLHFFDRTPQRPKIPDISPYFFPSMQGITIMTAGARWGHSRKSSGKGRFFSARNNPPSAFWKYIFSRNGFPPGAKFRYFIQVFRIFLGPKPISSLFIVCYRKQLRPVATPFIECLPRLIPFWMDVSFYGGRCFPKKLASLSDSSIWLFRKLMLHRNFAPRSFHPP